MTWWFNLKKWFFGLVPSKYGQLLSVISHGLLTVLCVVVGLLIGVILDLNLIWSAFSGYMFGLGGYTFREASEILNKGTSGLRAGIEDWLGSVIGGLIVLILVILLFV